MTSLPSRTRRIVVILNAGSGQGRGEALAERVERAFADRGADAEVRLVHDGAEIESTLEAAVRQSPDVIVAGGGDGTVSAVAAALLDRDIVLGVLPLGTLNHFAKDFGLPLEIEAAVAHVIDGEPVRVDVGEVNGRVFVNNSSLGLYPDIVRDRERQQKRLGRGKWLALMRASVSVFARYPLTDVRLSVDGKDQHWRTPFVFVGNNEYRMEGLALGEREGLQDGLLSLYVAHRPGRLRLLQLAVRALLGRLLQARDFAAMSAAEVVVDSRHHRLRVATDGEVTVMTPPLTYRIRRASLGVMRAGAPSEPA